jgi:aldehyde:ferredoxin oxidoreductase
MQMIANRQGLGDIAAEGTYRAAKSLNAEKYAFCVRKSSTGLHLKSHLAKSLSYATSTRGGDHLKAYVFTSVFSGFFSEVVTKNIFKTEADKNFAKPEKKGRIVWWHENYKYIVDSLGVCVFVVQALPSMGVALFKDFAEIMNAQFNLDLKDVDVLYASERIYQMQNAFNINCSADINSYNLPKRQKDKDIEDSIIEETSIDLLQHNGMLPEYFRFRGLTKDGRPTKERFEELGLYDYVEKAKAIQNKDVSGMSALMEEVNLNFELSKGDKIKSKLINTLLCKLVDKKDKRNIAMQKK